jgi:phosphatidylserine decarboxylase
MDDHKATYESQPGRSITQWIKSQPLYDRLEAAYRNTRWSTREIEPFIRKYNIDMSEFEPVKYRSFAEFFDRRFRPGARKFPSAADEMGAFAEARYIAWERLAAEQRFPVKGHSLSAEHILGNAQRARPFIGGAVLLVRLAPVDYHRVHYCDDGTTLDHERLGHRLWTVNQHALKNKQDILFSNERNINILDTRHFGRLAFVEIGALSVGRIVQTHPPRRAFSARPGKIGLLFWRLCGCGVWRTRGVAPMRRYRHAHDGRRRDARAAWRNHRRAHVTSRSTRCSRMGLPNVRGSRRLYAELQSRRTTPPARQPRKALPQSE